MKTYISIVLLTVFSWSPVFAGDSNKVGVDYQFTNPDGSGNPNGNSFDAIYDHKFNSYVSAGAKIGSTYSNGTVNNSKVESGAKFYYPIGSFTPYLHTSVGERFTKTTNYPYYGIGPGIKYVINQSLTLDANWKYQDSFNTNYNYKSYSGHISLDYAVSQHDNVILGVSRTEGADDLSVSSTSFVLGYRRGF